jgi:hypothetical protein
VKDDPEIAKFGVGIAIAARDGGPLANYILDPSRTSLAALVVPILFSPTASAAPSLANEKYVTAYFSVRMST